MLTFSAKIFTLAVLLTVVVFLAVVLWQSLFPSHHPKYNAAAENQQYAQEQSSEQKAPVSELKASVDERLATYTLALAIFTALLVLISAFQIGFLISADETATETAKAAQQSAKAAIKAVNSLPNVERAYVYLHHELTETLIATPAPEGQPPKVLYTFRNYGKTPAVMVDLYAFARYIPEGFPKITRVENQGFAPPIVFAPYTGADKPFLFSALIEVPTSEQIEKTRAGVGKIFFWGLVEYKDVFGGIHETGFCWEYNFEAKGFFLAETKMNYQN
jgi:hypothetical protein